MRRTTTTMILLAALAGCAVPPEATPVAKPATGKPPATTPAANPSPAATLAPVGPGPTNAPVVTGQGTATLTLSPASQQAGAELSKGLAEAADGERELDDFGLIVDDGSGIVAAGGGNIVAAGGGNIVAAGGGNIVAAGGGNIVAAGGGNYALLAAEDEDAAPTLAVTAAALAKADVAAALRNRRKATGDAQRARLAARPDRAALVTAFKAAKPVDQGDGTVFVGFRTTLPRPGGGTRAVRCAFTLDKATNALVHYVIVFPKAGPRVPGKPTRREWGLDADGNVAVVFHQEAPTPLGRRIADWTRKVAKDGALSGTGTLRWQKPDGTFSRRVTVAIEGTEDAPVLAAAEEGGKLKARLAARDGKLQATVSDESGAQATVDPATAPSQAVAEPETP